VGGTAWNSLFTTLKLAGISAPLTAALGLLAAWLLVRQRFKPAGAFEFATLLSLRHSGHGAGRELHPGLQRAADRAHRHRR
jgi:ABC-type Fe3+ transport system permease subunit